MNRFSFPDMKWSKQGDRFEHFEERRYRYEIIKEVFQDIIADVNEIDFDQVVSSIPMRIREFVHFVQI